MKKRAIALLLICAATADAGEIRKWVDEDGDVHYGDSATPGYRGQSRTVHGRPSGRSPIYVPKPSIGRVTWRLLESRGGSSTVAWKCTAHNMSKYPQSFDLEVTFLNGDGYELKTERTSVSLGPWERKDITGAIRYLEKPLFRQIFHAKTQVMNLELN